MTAESLTPAERAEAERLRQTLRGHLSLTLPGATMRATAQTTPAQCPHCSQPVSSRAFVILTDYDGSLLWRGCHACIVRFLTAS